MLQQPHLELQLFVDFGKPLCSFRNPAIEFTRNSLLFTQERCMPTRDHVLVLEVRRC